ncbi:hypothetical protein HNP81_002000 [Peribacillus huizhouensis]|uniref:Uncharacterized protein n=1 Tax=Peribacillus huizhouensis TaxID=1501239 RepID=A0ABR6CQ60_9BACI|nr:hypothetical protein [Peribacillus huizhouensis]
MDSEGNYTYNRVPVIQNSSTTLWNKGLAIRDLAFTRRE